MCRQMQEAEFSTDCLLPPASDKSEYWAHEEIDCSVLTMRRYN